LADTGKLSFVRQGIGDIQVWDTAQPSKRTIKSIQEFQRVLRRCKAVDELTIGMFSARELNATAVQVQNFSRALQELGL
jgi:hypothetical protein